MCLELNNNRTKLFHTTLSSFTDKYIKCTLRIYFIYSEYTYIHLLLDDEEAVAEKRVHVKTAARHDCLLLLPHERSLLPRVDPVHGKRIFHLKTRPGRSKHTRQRQEDAAQAGRSRPTQPYQNVAPETAQEPPSFTANTKNQTPHYSSTGTTVCPVTPPLVSQAQHNACTTFQKRRMDVQGGGPFFPRPSYTTLGFTTLAPRVGAGLGWFGVIDCVPHFIMWLGSDGRIGRSGSG